jgi:hypothetical protein
MFISLLAALVFYPYPERTVYTYLESLGRSNTVEEFLAAVRSQRRGNWDTNFTACAINDYLRRGFARLCVTTTNLPNAILGETYAAALQHYGGRDSNWWSLAQGSLPDGLALSSSAVISGTPSQLVFATFHVRVEDTSGARHETPLELIVVPEPAFACLLLALTYIGAARGPCGVLQRRPAQRCAKWAAAPRRGNV